MKSAEIGRSIVPGEFLTQPAICYDEPDDYYEPFFNSRKVFREFGYDFAKKYVDEDIHFLRYATELLGPAMAEDTLTVEYLRETALTADMFPELSQNKSHTIY